METLNCFDLHNLVLNDDDDIQNAYCKLYNFCMRSLRSSTKLKTKFEKLTSSKLVVKSNLKENDFYIPPFKRNNEELKANIARIDKGKKKI